MTTNTLEKPATKEVATKRRGDFGSSLRSVDTEKRIATFIASTPAIDSYGESIDQNGWDLKRFLAHPVIPFGHDYWALPVGKAIRVEVVNGNLEVDIQFASAEANPVAENVWQCIVGEVPLAVSVGFMPKEWYYEENGTGGQRRVYTEQELLEVSIVTIPSNPEALQKAISEGLRSTKKERRENANAALELMTRIFAIKMDEPEPEPEEEPETEPEVDETVQETEEHDIIKAYRKLVPALRGLLNADTKDDELEQIAEIREALTRRDAEPEDKKEEDDKGTEIPAEETPTPEAPAEPPAETPAEPEIPAPDAEATPEEVQEVAEATAELLLAEDTNQ